MAWNLSRRDVLRGLGGLALAPAIRAAPFRTQSGCPISFVPAVPNRPRTVLGLEAYAQKSVAAGETVDFRISSPDPGSHRISLVRLGWDTDLLAKDWILETREFWAPGAQPIRPGSYIHVEGALGASTFLPELTLECWVRPFRKQGNFARQGILAQYSEPAQCGFALAIDEVGRLVAYFGDGTFSRPEWRRTSPSGLSHLEWQHVAATFDAGTVTLYLDGVQIDQGELPGLTEVVPGTAPLRIGAFGDASGTSGFLDGDLAMPVIYGRALHASEIAARAQSPSPPHVPSDPSLFGCWPLAEETGTTVADASPCGRTGVIVNRGTWMIGGPTFDADGVPPDYDPDADPSRGHGLRLSGSDLYDCGWPVTQSMTVPADCPPGVYVGRIESDAHPRYDVTFVVRRAESRPRAPIVVLCATNTWLAYNKSFDLFSLYDEHAGTQPTYHQGFQMPWSRPVPYGLFRSNADPYVTYSTIPGYSHLVRAERFLHVWLEQNGYEYDVIGDRDLHTTPGILDGYRVLVVAGHSEYWTREAQDKVQEFVSAGGRLVVLSGNTMFWRVSMDDGVLECRKPPGAFGGHRNARLGETFHEHDHEPGGWMRRSGRAAWEIVGLECIGFDGAHVPYEVTDPAHPFFQGPEEIDVAPSGGDPVELGGPLAVGHEWDVSLSRIPGHPVEGPPVNVLAEARGDGSQGCFDYDLAMIPSAGAVISEIVEWTSGRGRVFAAGSIAAGQALHADPKMGALLRNVLHHFGVVVRLHALAVGQNGRLHEARFDGASWSALASDALSDFGSDPPTCVPWGTNGLAALAVSSSGTLLFRSWNGRAWSAWSDIGPPGTSLVGRPAAVGWGRNRLDIWVRDESGHLHHRSHGEGGFGPWSDLGGTFGSDPAAAAWEGNHLSVAVLDADNHIRFREWSAGVWGPRWRDMGGNFTRAPTLLSFGGHRLGVFAVDAAGRAWTKTRTGKNWSPSFLGWQELGRPNAAALAGRVHAVVTGHDQNTGLDTLTLFGIAHDGRLKTKWFDGTQWGPSPTGWADLGGSLVGEPAAVSLRGGRISVFAVGTDGQLWRIDWNGTAWSPWQPMGGALVGTPAAVAWVRSNPSRFVPSSE